MGIQSTSSAWEANDWVACTPATVSRAWAGEPTPLQLALTPGHRWLAMLAKNAHREGVDARYGSRMVNLTNLASDIVALVLDETLPAEVTQFDRAVARWRCGRSKADRYHSVDNSDPIPSTHGILCPMATLEQVLSYWFPTGCDADEERYWRQIRWWFDGGPEVDRDIAERFLGTLEGAVRGELDPWSETPRGCLALIIVLDQFSRNVYRGRPEAYAQDPTAQALALSGLDARMESTLALGDPMFFLLPLGHAEVLALHDRAQPYLAQIVEQAPAHLYKVYAFFAEQARAHRETVARFERFPHRNEILGRPSTPEEARSPSAKSLAVGLVKGNPVSIAIQEREVALDPIVDALEAALARVGGNHPFRSTMRALVVTARAGAV